MTTVHDLENRVERLEARVLWLEQEVDSPGHSPQLPVKSRLHKIEKSQEIMLELAKMRRSEKREARAWAAVVLALAGLVVEHVKF